MGLCMLSKGLWLLTCDPRARGSRGVGCDQGSVGTRCSWNTAGLISRDQAGGSSQPFLLRSGVGPWEGTQFIRSLCLCPGGTGMSPAPGRSCSQHLGALLKVRAALVLPFQHPTCPWKPTWILPGTCCSPNISSAYPELDFTS